MKRKRQDTVASLSELIRKKPAKELRYWIGRHLRMGGEITEEDTRLLVTKPTRGRPDRLEQEKIEIGWAVLQAEAEAIERGEDPEPHILAAVKPFKIYTTKTAEHYRDQLVAKLTSEIK